MLGIAQTGTGKTAAFGIPLLQKLSIGHVPPQPRQAKSLILAPTRELAVQIEQSLRTYGRYLNLKLAVILGGVSQNSQVYAMKHGVDIWSPRRAGCSIWCSKSMCAWMRCRSSSSMKPTACWTWAVIRDVRKIVNFLPRERQSMLFSATMPTMSVKLGGDMLKSPERIEVTPQSKTADRIVQKLFYVPHAAEAPASPPSC